VNRARFSPVAERAWQPAEFGFPASPRQTPGLRRAEVAVLAGMNVSWYTWLDQGRDIRP